MLDPLVAVQFGPPAEPLLAEVALKVLVLVEAHMRAVVVLAHVLLAHGAHAAGALVPTFHVALQRELARKG